MRQQNFFRNRRVFRDRAPKEVQRRMKGFLIKNLQCHNKESYKPNFALKMVQLNKIIVCTVKMKNLRRIF